MDSTKRKARFATGARIREPEVVLIAEKQEKIKKCEKLYIVCEKLYNIGLLKHDIIIMF